MWVTLPEGGSPFFKENGNYQATHAINMGFKKLLNLSTPSEPYEAATKEYVDNVKKNTIHPHIIAMKSIITAYYVVINISSLLEETP